MGYRGKFMTADTGIILPASFVDKYKENYHIDSGRKKPDGEEVFYLNISSRTERKEHWEIREDLQEILKGRLGRVYGIVLWEDGMIYRYNLITGEHETFEPEEY